MRLRYKSSVRHGNHFALLRDGHDFFARMLAAIDASQHYVLAEFYLVESGAVTDAFVAALLRASARGVAVRAIFDAFGARGFAEHDRARLRAGGVDLVLYNELRWTTAARLLLRDHRKLLLVDGTIGFTGGAGLTDAFSPDVRPGSYWRDCMVQMSGPVLTDWHALFAGTWQRCGRGRLDITPQPPAVAHPGDPGRVIASAGLGRKDLGGSVVRRVRHARRRVWIATPYFWPSMRLRRVLKRAARRGLDVRLVLAGSHTDAPRTRLASRLFFERLLVSGVTIYEYQPGFLHCKLALCDDWASIGSSNLDRWGTLWNLDANQEIVSVNFARQAEALFLQICQESAVLKEPREVKPSWNARFWQRVAQLVFAWSARGQTRLQNGRSNHTAAEGSHGR